MTRSSCWRPCCTTWARPSIAQDHADAGAEAVRGAVTERTLWLIEHHMDLLLARERALSARLRRELEASEYLEDLKLLRELDDAGRVPGMVVETLDEVLAYIKGLEHEAYLEHRLEQGSAWDRFQSVTCRTRDSTLRSDTQTHPADHLAAVAGEQHSRDVFGSTLSLMNRTEPSANEKVVPPGWWPKMPFRSSLGSTSQSSGLVQVTARSSPASTTKIVFEVPSVIFWILMPSEPGKIVALPRGVR